MQEKLTLEEFIMQMAIELVEFREYDYIMNKNNPSWPFLLTEEDWKAVYDIFKASKTASKPFSTPSQWVGS